MQFNDHLNLRNHLARFATSDSLRKFAKKVKPDEFRKIGLEFGLEQIKADGFQADASLGVHCQQIVAESRWVESERPFYNIWPVVSDLAKTLKLDLPFAAVRIPFEALVLRFSKDFEPNVKTAMIHWPKEPVGGENKISVFSFRMDEPDCRITVRYRYSDPQTSVQSWLEALLSEGHPEVDKIGEHLIRLTVFVGLLANERDFITPIVLAKDQRKYDSTTDDDIRQAIERRAMRRLGRGFDVGKALQLEKEQSPHWRNPHLALFWTGKGRLKPIIKMRSGAIIHRVSMSEVPTGFLGPETAKDAEFVEEVQRERVAISTKKRFEIFKRDNYRCQICGAKADEGAALHVDHRKAVAMGGKNDDDNLWTLCDRCNLGKSDLEL